MLLALTTPASVAIVSNMKAVLVLHERRDIAEDRFVELVVWQVPRSVRTSTHLFKYRLAFVVVGLCVLRYDNEVARAITGTLARWRCGNALQIHHPGTALCRFHGRRDELESLR